MVLSNPTISTNAEKMHHQTIGIQIYIAMGLDEFFESFLVNRTCDFHFRDALDLCKTRDIQIDDHEIELLLRIVRDFRVLDKPRLAEAEG